MQIQSNCEGMPTELAEFKSQNTKEEWIINTTIYFELELYSQGINS